jgi:hypothetical protein
MPKGTKPKSKVKCPQCRSVQFVAIYQTELALELFSLGPSGEIIPLEGAKPYKEGKKVHLYCYDCGWEGTVEKYYEELSGVVRIFGDPSEYTKATKK